MSLKEKLSFKRYPVTYTSLSFLFFILIFLLFNRLFFAPKILLLCAIILVAVFLGKLKVVMKDWFIFLAFIYLFDSLRGTIYALTCDFSLPVHTLYVIRLENFLFGKIPSVVLQHALLKNAAALDFGWPEKFLTAVHGTHFIAFLLVGLTIWLQKQKYFGAFKSAFYWITGLGVLGYFIVPTVPPWMASRLFGVLPEIYRFNIHIYNMSIPDLTSGFNTNPISAMPSLHAAFPILACLVLWRLYRWKATPFILYTLLMLFTIVYTGDHYIVDILAGGILAVICYFIGFRRTYLRITKESENPCAPGKNRAGFLWKNKHLLIGALLLAVGIPLGTFNKHKFDNDPDAYDYKSAPRYIDFFNHEEDYRQNYLVQLYFGDFHLTKKHYDQALIYLNRAVALSRNIIEKKAVLVKIKQIESILSRTGHNQSP
ncbi:MAG: phosphatase PAP2 family protein [Candidatus Aminicenantales bacterium]